MRELFRIDGARAKQSKMERTTCKSALFWEQTKFKHVLVAFSVNLAVVFATVPETKTAVIKYTTTPISIEKIVPLGMARSGSCKAKHSTRKNTNP